MRSDTCWLSRTASRGVDPTDVRARHTNMELPRSFVGFCGQEQGQRLKGERMSESRYPGSSVFQQLHKFTCRALFAQRP